MELVCAHIKMFANAVDTTTKADRSDSNANLLVHVPIVRLHKRVFEIKI
jgi:hypothetical protein